MYIYLYIWNHGITLDSSCLFTAIAYWWQGFLTSEVLGTPFFRYPAPTKCVRTSPDFKNSVFLYRHFFAKSKDNPSILTLLELCCTQHLGVPGTQPLFKIATQWSRFLDTTSLHHNTCCLIGKTYGTCLLSLTQLRFVFKTVLRGLEANPPILGTW